LSAPGFVIDNLEMDLTKNCALSVKVIVATDNFELVGRHQAKQVNDGTIGMGARLADGSGIELTNIIKFVTYLYFRKLIS
jgi:hypothetical protein